MRKTVKNCSLPRCGNCRFFARHYVLDRDLGFVACVTGHCLQDLRRKGDSEFLEACEKYEKSPAIGEGNS